MAFFYIIFKSCLKSVAKTEAKGFRIEITTDHQCVTASVFTYIHTLTSCIYNIYETAADQLLIEKESERDRQRERKRLTYIKFL